MNGFDLNSFLTTYGGMPGPFDPQQASPPTATLDPSSTSSIKSPSTTLKQSGYAGYPVSQPQRSSFTSSQPLEGQVSSSVGPSRNNGLIGKAAVAGSSTVIGGTGGDAMSEGSSTAPRRQSSTPYARQDGIQQKQPKSSSTTALFNTRKNWSQYILESIEDFMHVISTDGTFIFASASVDTLCGYDPEELRGQNFFSFLHPSDVEPFKREFFHCLASPKNTPNATNPERLTAHYRFRTKDDRHVLFEVTGHFFSGSTAAPNSTTASTSTDPSTSAAAEGKGGGGSQPKCFFGLARPYPSRSIAMLDSFLELKMENERLRQELLILYEEIEGDGAALSPTGLRLQQEQQRASVANQNGPSSSAAYPPKGDLFDARTSASVIDPSTGLIRTSELIPSTSNTYGALGIGISANGKKGDGQSEKRRRQKQKMDGESDLVCRDCGRIDSPEWRKGPEGPKTLCNACGLRYAKLKSRLDKQASGAIPTKKNRT
ncbi:PAS domain-containing GATA-type transcription factor [Sporobolomyces salmoneus]|uniref:PAS domain-containing GATA-type transcription factor n=1 Tax=Sporobolomyces salmoneus TaxID=183962 RepID=UPI0031779647